MSADMSGDIARIQDEDVLRKMWQDTEDFSKKKEIRSHMYKLREERLKNFYCANEPGSDIYKTQSTPGLNEKSLKDGNTLTHADSFGDHSFLSLKSKEIRDSESPTRDVAYRISDKSYVNPNWNIVSKSEVSNDGKTHSVSAVATTSGKEQIKDGVANYAALCEQNASIYADGDDKNYTKSSTATSKGYLQQSATTKDNNSETQYFSSTDSSSSKTVTQQQSTNYLNTIQPLPSNNADLTSDSVIRKTYTTNIPNEFKSHPHYVEGKTKVTTETRVMPDGTKVTTTRYETKGVGKLSSEQHTTTQQQRFSTVANTTNNIVQDSDLNKLSREPISKDGNTVITVKVYKLSNDNNNQGATQQITRTTSSSTEVKENHQIVDENRNDVKQMKVIQEREYLPRSNRSEPHETSSTASHTTDTRITNIQNKEVSNSNEPKVKPQTPKTEPEYVSEETFSTTTSTNQDFTKKDQSYNNVYDYKEDYPITQEPLTTSTNEAWNIKKVHQQEQTSSHTSKPISPKPSKLDEIKPIPEKNRSDIIPDNSTDTTTTIITKIDETDRVFKTEPYTKPQDSVTNEVVIQQQQTTYKSNYTSQRISVEVSPTHDAFARSLRAISPINDQKRGDICSPVPTNQHGRRSATPDKHPSIVKDRLTHKKTNPSIEGELHHKRSSPSRQEHDSSPKKQLQNEEVQKDFYNTQTIQKSTRTTVTSNQHTTNRKRSQSPTVTPGRHTPKNKNIIDSEKENIIKRPTDAIPGSRPTSLNVTASEITRTSKKITDRSPTSPLTPTKNKPQDKPLKRRDTYEERCRQILGIDKSNDEKTIPATQKPHEKPRRPNDQTLQSPTKDKFVANVKTTLTTTATLSKTDQVNKKKLQEYPSQVRKSPEKILQQTPVNYQSQKDGVQPCVNIPAKQINVSEYHSPVDQIYDDSKFPLQEPEPYVKESNPKLSELEKHPSQTKKLEKLPTPTKNIEKNTISNKHVPESVTPERTPNETTEYPVQYKQPIYQQPETHSYSPRQSPERKLVSTKTSVEKNEIETKVESSKVIQNIQISSTQNKKGKYPSQTSTFPDKPTSKQASPTKIKPDRFSPETCNIPNKTTSIREKSVENLTSRQTNSTKSKPSNKNPEYTKTTFKKTPETDIASYGPKSASPIKDEEDVDEVVNTLVDIYTEQIQQKDSIVDTYSPREDQQKAKPQMKDKINRNVTEVQETTTTTQYLDREHPIPVSSKKEPESYPHKGLPASNVTTEVVINVVEKSSQRKDFNKSTPNNNLNKQPDCNLPKSEYYPSGKIPSDSVPDNVPVPEEIISITDGLRNQSYPPFREHSKPETYTEEQKYTDFYKTQTHLYNNTTNSNIKVFYDTNTITRRPKGNSQVPNTLPTNLANETKPSHKDDIIIDELILDKSPKKEEEKPYPCHSKHSPEKYPSENTTYEEKRVVTLNKYNTVVQKPTSHTTHEIYPSENNSLTRQEPQYPLDEDLYGPSYNNDIPRKASPIVSQTETHTITTENVNTLQQPYKPFPKTEKTIYSHQLSPIKDKPTVQSKQPTKGAIGGKPKKVSEQPSELVKTTKLEKDTTEDYSLNMKRSPEKSLINKQPKSNVTTNQKHSSQVETVEYIQAIKTTESIPKLETKTIVRKKEPVNPVKVTEKTIISNKTIPTKRPTTESKVSRLFKDQTQKKKQEIILQGKEIAKPDNQIQSTEENIVMKKVSQLEETPNINEPVCTKKFISNLCREEELQRNPALNVTSVHKTIKKDSPEKTITTEFIENERNNSEQLVSDLEDEIIVEVDDQTNPNLSRKPLDITHKEETLSKRMVTQKKTENLSDHTSDNKTKRPIVPKEPGWIQTKTLKNQDVSSNKLDHFTHQKPTNSTTRKEKTYVPRADNPFIDLPEKSEPTLLKPDKKIRPRTTLQTSDLSNKPKPKLLLSGNDEDNGIVVNEITTSCRQIEVTKPQKVSPEKTSKVSSKYVVTQLKDRKSTDRDEYTTKKNTCSVPIKQQSPIKSQPDKVFVKKDISKVHINKDHHTSQQTENIQKPISKNVSPAKDIPKVTNSTNINKKHKVTATVQVSPKNTDIPKKKPLLEPQNQVVSDDSEEEQPYIDIDQKFAKNVVTTKSVLINNNLDQDNDVIITLHRSTSSREATPNRICPQPASEEEDYGMPRYPDTITEPTENVRKPFYIHEPKPEVTNYLTEVDDQIHAVRIDRVDETDESLLSVTQKVSKFINEAEKLTKTENTRGSYITPKQDHTKNLPNVDYITVEEIPSRPKSPRCENYPLDDSEESYTAVSQRVSQFIKTAESISLPQKPDTSGFSPKTKQPGHAHIDKEDINNKHLVGIADKIHKFTVDQKANNVNKPISLTKLEMNPKKPYNRTPDCPEIDTEEQTYDEKAPMDKNNKNLNASTNKQKQTFESNVTPKSSRQEEKPKHFLNTTERFRSTDTVRKAKELFEQNSKNSQATEVRVVKKLVYPEHLPKVKSKTMQPSEDQPSYMKPLDKSQRPHESSSSLGSPSLYHKQEHTHLLQTTSPQPHGSSHEELPHYMRPLNRTTHDHINEHERSPSRSTVDTPDLQTRRISHESITDQQLTGYNKLLDKQFDKHDHSSTRFLVDVQTQKVSQRFTSDKQLPGYMKPLERHVLDATDKPSEKHPNYMKKTQESHLSPDLQDEQKPSKPMQPKSPQLHHSLHEDPPHYMWPLDRTSHDHISEHEHSPSRSIVDTPDLQTRRISQESITDKQLSGYNKPLEKHFNEDEHSSLQSVVDLQTRKVSQRFTPNKQQLPGYMKPVEKHVLDTKDKPSEKHPSYMKKPHESHLSSDLHNEQEPTKPVQTKSPQFHHSSHEELPHYMWPLDRTSHDHINEHEHSPSRSIVNTPDLHTRQISHGSTSDKQFPGSDKPLEKHPNEDYCSSARSVVDTPDLPTRKISRGSTPDKQLPGYMKPLERHVNQTKPNKFGVTLRSANFSKPRNNSQSKHSQSYDINDLLAKSEFDHIYDIEVLEILLQKATSYEQRRKIRAQIRIVKLNINNNLQTYRTEPEQTRPSNKKSEEAREQYLDHDKNNTEHFYHKTSDQSNIRTEYQTAYQVQEQFISTKSSKPKTADTLHTQEEHVVTKQTYCSSQLTPKKLKKGLPEDNKPSWVKQVNLKKASERPHRVSTTTTTKNQTITKTKPPKDDQPTDVITSSYGVGPTDENGSPLFGLRALRVQNQTESRKVQGTVIQSHYYSKNGQEPVGEIRVTKYSSDPRDLEGHVDEDKNGLVSVTTIQKIGPNDLHRKEIADQQTTDVCDEEFEESLRKKTTTTEVRRRDSVKEMTKKFIDNSETSKSDKQTSYPKAGLILRTSSFKETGKPDAKKPSVSDNQDSLRTVTVTKTVTSSEQGGQVNTFLTNKSRVQGVQDTITRMKNTDHDVQIDDSPEDTEARALLNKFIGSQVILSGMESRSTSSISGGTSFKKTTTTTTTTDGSEKPTVISRTFTHPITEDELASVWDEETLKLLLERSTEYEERRIIRSRLREIMAEQEVCANIVSQANEESSGRVEEVETSKTTYVEGPLTTNKVTTRVTSQQVTKKPLSPFAKFQQLDKQNSLNSPGTPRTPTGSGPLFKFTDPELKRQASTVKERLLQWCQMKTKEYENVQLDNFSSSWSDGLAFCALIHHFLPDAFDYHALTPNERRHNFDLAFRIADEKANIAPLLDVEDMIATRKPDWKCVFTYVQTIYARFKNED